MNGNRKERMAKRRKTREILEDDTPG